MNRCYIVSYDISDDKRLRRVAKVVEAYGKRVQFSVFRCELTARKRLRLESELGSEIDHRDDQVLFIDLGPIPGTGEDCITSLGRPYLAPPKHAIVL